MKIFSLVLLSLFLTGCFEDEKDSNSVQLGKITFAENCAVCHGKVGEGIVKDWKSRQADGSFPPPPVNGTAHAWHHSPKLLLNTINNGGEPLGGIMPAFKDKLNAEEKQALIDYMHSLWPLDIQQKYDSRFK
jgi:mono/diheme cytochrome c family protein